jgi:hypothetical protein
MEGRGGTLLHLRIAGALHGFHQLSCLRHHVNVVALQCREGTRENSDPLLQRGSGIEQDQGLAVEPTQPPTANGGRLEELDANRHPELVRGSDEHVNERIVLHPGRLL